VDSRELIRKAEVAELLLLAARRLGESIEPERVYERFHELIGDVLQHDGLLVSSYNDREDMIRCEYAWTDGAAIDPATLPPLQLNREGGGMQSRVIVTGEPVLFDNVPERVTTVDGVYYNVDAEGRVEKIPDTGPAKTTSAMMVPVKDEGRVVGVVQLMTDRGVYSEDDLDLFDGLVAQMGAAVRNVFSRNACGSRLPRQLRVPSHSSASKRLMSSRPWATGSSSSTSRESSASGTPPPRASPGSRPTRCWGGSSWTSFRPRLRSPTVSRSPPRARWPGR
jgi:hypothetical protein